MVVALRPEIVDVGDSGLRLLFESLDEEHQTNVVRWSLANRTRVSEEARVALNNALIGNVSVRGFRESSVPDAPAIMLIQPVRKAALVVDPIAEAILTVWQESRLELGAVVGAVLNQPDIETDAGEADGMVSTDDSSHDDVPAAITAANPQYSADDVNLMVALTFRDIAQQAEDEQPEESAEPTEAQRMFDDFLGALRALPSDCPEWDAPLTQLMHDVTELRADKTRENEHATGVGSRIAEVLDAHDELLAFFEWDGAERLPHRTGPWADAALARDAVDTLAELLERYEALRETGATYSEEARRTAERVALREQIVGALDTLEDAATLDEPEPIIEEIIPSDDETTDEEIPAPAPTDGADHLERQFLREMVEALQRENYELKSVTQAAKKDYQDLKQEHRELRYEAESTRLSYIDAQKTEEETLEAPPDFGDVASVLEFVENRWSQGLRLALNNTSDRKMYFDQPNQVYSALEWLATTYRDSRTGEKPVGNLDVSLFTTCGWRYRPFQSEITVGKYRSDYETADDGRKYILEEHIGRGTGRTPGQIRLAFTWDEERKMVIVGYIGRHQRTGAS